MTRKEMLEGVVADYNSHECIQIELVWKEGTRSGIGNPKAIKAAMDALKEELKRQLDECL